MWMTGAATHVEAADWPEPPLVVVTVPVLSTTPLPGQEPPEAAVVGEVTCTVNVLAAWVVPAGTVTPAAPPQVRVPPAIEQLPPQPAPCASTDQLRPALAGRPGSGSDNFTPAASPGPALETVNVKPIGLPALTCAASAVFTMWIAGAATHVKSVELSEPALVVVTVPVFWTVPVPGQEPPVAVVVGEVMWTVKVLAACVVPAGTVTPAAPPQERTPPAIEHVPPHPAPCASTDQLRPAFTGR